MIDLDVEEKEITLEEASTPIGDYWPNPLSDIFSAMNRSTITTFVNRIHEITGYTEAESRDYFEKLVATGVIHEEPNGYFHITSIKGEKRKRPRFFGPDIS